MHIAGFQSISLNEYPGQISAIVFTQGCNFRCPYCHNPELQKFLTNTDKEYRELLQEEDVLDKISKLKDKITGVTISGGEPLTWNDLAVFMKKIKNRGLLVKLNTNGSYFYRLKYLIDNNLVDYVDMDVKAPPNKYKKIAGDDIDLDSVKKSVEYLKSSDVDHIFTTVWDKDLLTEKDTKYILKWVGSSRHEIREKI